MDDRDESLLLRWSRRKAEARQGKTEPAAPDVKPADAAVEQVQSAALPAEEKAADAPADMRLEDLPDIETLNYESDFTAFLREGVPELIKRQALRKLWTSDPILANLDGLNDYDPKSMTFLIQDLAGAAEPIAEVGRGLRDKIMDGKRAREGRPHGRRQPHSGQPRRPERAATPPADPAPSDTSEARERVEKKNDDA
jgi:Protein of unknown function (DUF3306)